ncbi:MAG: 4Fe-4S dicluster domain-containing protein [Bacillota bacterium]
MKMIYDERNTMFSRARLKPGTKAYTDFYNAHPHLKPLDDKVRGMDITEKLRKSDHYKSLFLPLTESNTTIIKALHDIVNKKPIAKKQPIPNHFHKNIKAITNHFGAAKTGIVKLTKAHYYSHHGGVNDRIGITNNYGLPTDKHYTHAIVYMIPMNLEYINRAPFFEEMLETEHVYVKIAETGSKLALYLKSIGYDAMFQSEAYYLTPLVPLAYDAGLGEIGMANHIVTPEFGDRVRLGAVLTTLPLKQDAPIDFGLEQFCKRCALCLMNCPSHSIKPHKRIVNGRPFYKFDDQTCFNLWKNTGTDCGTCIQSCPFSQGIDKKTIDAMKENPTLIDEIIQAHLEKHGRRRMTKEELPIVRLEEKE